jgi:hypothetical protein
MSAASFDTLCELWAATLAPHHTVPPFSNHRALCQTIDAIPIGGVSWESVSLVYSAPKPDDALPWMENEYTIWYRDPHALLKDMLGDPMFMDYFDYAPLRKYDANGDRQYENFMSGDWAWKQAVSERLRRS